MAERPNYTFYSARLLAANMAKVMAEAADMKPTTPLGISSNFESSRDRTAQIMPGMNTVVTIVRKAIRRDMEIFSPSDRACLSHSGSMVIG
jgi:hypothetical protein